MEGTADLQSLTWQRPAIPVPLPPAVLPAAAAREAMTMTGLDELTRKTPKKLHVITWGCQMNVYDSARMADTLAPLGYAPAAGVDDADMVILNTCHIRDRATEKVFSELGQAAPVIKADSRAAAGQGTILAVAGCVAQAEGRGNPRTARPTWTSCIGPQTYHRLPEMVAQREPVPRVR